MQIGILTAAFRDDEWTLEKIISWAGDNGIDSLEIAVPRHLDVRALLEAQGQADLKAQLDAAGVSISSLAFYSGQITDPQAGPEQVELLKATVAAAESLGVDTVCTMAGFETPGKTKMETIRQDLPGIFEPVLADGAQRGVRLALENWFLTNLQHLDHWRAVFEVLPQENFGLNFDPSHLAWQEIDYLAAVEEFAGRIFHTHAKDVAVNDAALRRLGVLDAGWWRYTIPGTGRICWGEYIGKLREVGFDGVLSIEHEDATLSPTEGFRMGAGFLRGLIA